MTDLDLAAIRDRADAATLGPWTDPTFISDPPNEAGWWILGGGVPGSIHEHAVAVILPYNPHGRPDAEFVAHARTDVPALLAEVDRLRAELAESGQLRERLAALLTGTADALQGDPGPLSLHDWSDLPRVARLRVAELATSEAELARVTSERDCALRQRDDLAKLLADASDALDEVRAEVAPLGVLREWLATYPPLPDDVTGDPELGVVATVRHILAGGAIRIVHPTYGHLGES